MMMWFFVPVVSAIAFAAILDWRKSSKNNSSHAYNHEDNASGTYHDSGSSSTDDYGDFGGGGGD